MYLHTVAGWLPEKEITSFSELMDQNLNKILKKVLMLSNNLKKADNTVLSVIICLRK